MDVSWGKKKKHSTLGFVYKTIQTDEFLEDFFFNEEPIFLLRGNEEFII